MKQLIFVNSHPIQYFAPMYKYLNEQGIPTKAWYGSDKSIKGGLDSEFGTEVKWDIPLLHGYEYRFFITNSKSNSGKSGFFSLRNLDIVREMFRTPKSVIVVHGWHYLTHFLILMLGKLKGHTICLRNDIPQSHELLKMGWKQKLKKIGLKYLLFPRVNYFLYIGNQNRMFYKNYDLPDSRLLFCPYAVDNDRFKQDAALLTESVTAIRQEMGIAVDDSVIVFSAKYIAKKRPLDLLKAFKQLDKANCWLILVGEGELRSDMEAYIATYNLQKVILTGFINQSKISKYYAIADVFVMCSSTGENWGLSVNEAMNFNTPLVLSDLTGCGDDMVVAGANGYIFKTGDVDGLTADIDKVLFQRQLNMQPSSLAIVEKFSYSAVAKSLKKII